MEVVLSGSEAVPQVRLHSRPGERVGGRPLPVWAKEHGGRWQGAGHHWILTALGPRPSAVLGRAGIDEYTIDDDSEVEDIDDCAAPLVGILADQPRRACVYPRLSGFEACRELLPLTAQWVKAEQRFEMPATDAITASGEPCHPSLVASERVIGAALELHRQMIPAPLPDPDSDEAADARFFADQINDENLDDADLARIPEWFGLDLFGYQKAGALSVADGHTLLADAPGVGKTRQSLAAIAITGPKRSLFVVPPVVLTNWGREISASGIVEHSGEGAELVIIHAKRKVPDLPECGAVVIADSLLRSRPELFEDILAWRPTALVYDEAHRARTPTTATSQRMTELAAHIDGPRIALTGTPVLNETSELAPILAITGHLDRVFGGYTEFMNRYCRRNRFRAWVTNRKRVEELKALLDEHVWVRRTKNDVLPDLPKKLPSVEFVDVDLAEYRKAHREVIATVRQWLGEEHPSGPPTAQQMLDFAQDSIGLFSPMRRAAGLAKASVASDLVSEWVEANPAGRDGTFDRPLLLWAHHKDVVKATAAAARDAGVPVAVIDGSTPAERRSEITDAFQEGRIAVLVCSIAAASVGITLTHGSDMLFIEQDWTPAMNTQAADRMARIGQTRPVSVRTLLAADTLDEHVYRTLDRKSDLLDQILTGGDNRVTIDIDTGADLSTSTQIVLGLIVSVVDQAYTKSGALRRG